MVYGYGEGASSDKKGYNPTGGPVALHGKKLLPVLSVLSSPADPGLLISESLEIISHLQSSHGSIPCASSPSRLVDWKKAFDEVKRKLVRPRIVRMTHLKDWADERDVAYARNKYEKSGFDFDAALADSESLKVSMGAILNDLDSSVLLGGSESSPTVMQHGVWSMDDLCLVPDLRSLTAVKGVAWPPRVRKYVEGACGGEFGDYFGCAVE